MARTDKIFTAAAREPEFPVLYVGAKTGRDGIHGATMASAEFSDDADEKRPTVQVGDPFTEKLLIEACLELMATDAIVAIQDMGAAGLTSSSVEMATNGKAGIRLDMDKVPCREEGMTPYEMMLSESQERMLMVLKPGKEEMAAAIFEKWELDFAVIGEVTDTQHMVLEFGGEVVCDIPLGPLAADAPEYDRPYVETPAAEPLSDVPGIDPIDGLSALISSPNYASKAWVFEQYDTMVMGDSARTPGLGSGIVRVHGTDKAIAFTSDVTPRYVKANPVEGGKQAVAEAYRNLCAVGALPLATTDNLNFGNPEKPEIMGQFVGAIQGIGAACIALDMPIVSGNVSLYNETDGKGILPTPTIGAVGLLKHTDEIIGKEVREGHVALVLGATEGHIGQSALLLEVFNRRDGDAPHVDLALEKAHGEFIRANRALIKACTDLSDGGLALAAFELADEAGVGVTLDSADTQVLFGEDQARYLIACNFDQAEALMIAAQNAGLHLESVGKFGGDQVNFGGVKAPLADLSATYRGAFAETFA